MPKKRRSYIIITLLMGQVFSKYLKKLAIQNCSNKITFSTKHKRRMFDFEIIHYCRIERKKMMNYATFTQSILVLVKREKNIKQTIKKK